MRVRLSFIHERLAMDVLDQLLADLRQESCVFYRLDATEPWRIWKCSSALAPFYEKPHPFGASRTCVSAKTVSG